MEPNSKLILKKIEAVLFYLSEPISHKRLSEILDMDIDNLKVYIEELKKMFVDRGVSLIDFKEEIFLTTSKETSDCIDLLIQDEQKRDIGKAGIETLSIIAYKGNVTRKEIEYIRGVNSQFALRGLLIRGLIDKKPAPYDERVMVYSITTEALMHLGIKNIEELPEYDTVNKQLDISNIEDRDRE